MKFKEELNAIKEEYENMNKRLSELNEEELKQVTGAGAEGEMSSKDVYDVMFGYISQRDEFHAVYMYRSKGFLLDLVDSEKIHFLFRQFYGYEIEESPYFDLV